MSDSTPASAPSAGALIRAAREKQGLHIAALAAAIKVAPRKLDALENDRWNELPDATFTRALAQTVCRSLKIDARAVLDLLPPAETATLEPSAINEPFRERASRDEGGLAALAIKPMVIAAALLMVAAIAVYLMPTAWWQGGKTAGLVSTTVAPAAVATAASTPAEAASAAAAVEPPNAAAAPATVAVGVAPAASASVPAPASGETVFSAPPPSAVASGAASGAAANGAVQLRANDASWVDVRDARGRVLLSRTVQPGEDIGLDGEAPFRLVIGNAAATELTFRGQPVSLAGYTRDAVARLELK